MDNLDPPSSPKQPLFGPFGLNYQQRHIETSVQVGVAFFLCFVVPSALTVHQRTGLMFVSVLLPTVVFLALAFLNRPLFLQVRERIRGIRMVVGIGLTVFIWALGRVVLGLVGI